MHTLVPTYLLHVGVGAPLIAGHAADMLAIVQDGAPAVQETGAAETLAHGQAPTDIGMELDEAAIRRENLVQQLPGEGFDAPFRNALAGLEERLNLELGIAYTLLFQQATAGPGERNAAGADLDVFGRWTPVGAGTAEPGSLYASVEHRQSFGGLPPSDLGDEIGTLLRTTSGFNDLPLSWKETYWDQRLLDGSLRLWFGKANPKGLGGSYRLQSANTGFLYQAFSSNPSIAFPGSTLLLGAQASPTDNIYFSAGICNANGKANESPFVDLDEHEYFTLAEVGLTPRSEELGTSKLRFTAWHIDARESSDSPSDQGVCATLDQDLGERIQGFARYGRSRGRAAAVANLVEGGLAVRGLLGVEDNLSGMAISWSEPGDDDLRDEKALELFHRIQMSQHCQLTFDVELIVDPSDAPPSDAVGVFSVRLRFVY